MTLLSVLFWAYALICVNASPVDNGDESLARILNTFHILDDKDVIGAISYALQEASSTNDTCSACVGRLAIGKSLSLVRPDLIPATFEKWCNDNKYASKATCATNYHRNTIDASTTGSNFADMLRLMDPYGYDGQLYCHYKDNSACLKPETPNISLSHLWPEKQPMHMIAPSSNGSETFNVLHISDFHIELDYTVGAEANCSTSMCCTPHSINKKSNATMNTSLSWNSFYEGSHYNDSDFSFVRGTKLSDPFHNVSIPAPSFGHYECDAPELLINSSLNNVIDFAKKQSLDFQFAIFTGDLVDHDEYTHTDYEMTVKSEQFIMRDMKSRLGDMPVFPVLGNHDTFPYGELAQEGYGFSNKFEWNADMLAEIYQDYGWLDGKQAQYARHHYTGFSVTTKEGLKVVSLNSNAFYKKNHYCYWNATDPDSFGQWQFLIDELVESEENNQRVWIITHIPPITDSLPLPSKIFGEIVERFSPSTIAGIFFGHTHLDQFNLLYVNDTKSIENVINMAWIGQAVTPWVENNPAWRYYEVDSETFSIMNSYNYYSKLNETFANNGQEPEWLFEYSARNVYDINWPSSAPLNATYWHLVAEKVKSDVSYRQLYENLAKRWSPYVPDCSEGKNCETDYCFLSTFNLDDYDKCLAPFKA